MDNASYPAVKFVLRHGNLLAAVLAICLLIAGGWPAATGLGWWWAAAGIVAAGFGYLFVKLIVELVAIIADTLIPQ